MAKEKVIGLLLFIVAATVVIGGALWVLERQGRDVCGVCRRGIPAQARAVIEVEGRREAVCCARCALTLGRQSGKPVRLLEVTDYVSSRPMRPDDASYVEGSRIVLCERHEPALDATKHAHDKVFDRCEPSLYAFARRADAEQFARDFGGEVRSLAEITKEAGKQP